jgi:RNA polymerase sigma-70 factor (ECF subfamily)
VNDVLKPGGVRFTGEPAETTQILLDLGNGDRSAAKRLMPLVYDELHGLAQRYMQQERAGHTFQATAVVHEAYIRLVDQSRVDWKGRAHFFSVAAEMIRRILVDHARQHHAAKRGGAARRFSLTESIGTREDADIDLIALDEALEELGRLAPPGRRLGRSDGGILNA